MSQERSDTLVLFGATGDLAHKKIFPALYQMVAKGTLTVKQVQCVRAPCPPVATLDNAQVIWRSGMNGPGGQFGANILFARDGRSLFLSSGERQRFTPAQDPDQALGKILHLNLDGTAFAGNPMAKAGGVRAMTWSTGHRNPYGMAFDAEGYLWVAHFGEGTVDVLDPAGRTVERFPTPGTKPTNVAFGGPDRRTLVLTEVETGAVYRARARVAGLRLFGDG